MKSSIEANRKLRAMKHFGRNDRKSYYFPTFMQSIYSIFDKRQFSEQSRQPRKGLKSKILFRFLNLVETKFVQCHLKAVRETTY